MVKEENVGSRKVVLTKWLLLIFTIGTAAYLFVMMMNGDSLPDSFYMNFVLGLGIIGGSFTLGNAAEHWVKIKAEGTK